jgi:hypothetical protein
MGKSRNQRNIHSVLLTELGVNHLEDLSEDGRIILKCILKMLKKWSSNPQ